MTSPSPATVDREREALPYPPPWMDLETLAAHICVAPRSVTNWVAQGILPPARKRGGKLMWKWNEVDDWLTRGKSDGSPNDIAERVRNGTRKEVAAGRAGH